jgi:hypothetical protein
MNWLICSLLREGKQMRAFGSSALWQIYQTRYPLFRMQKCRFTTPQDAGMIVLSMGGMGYSLICLRSPDPMEWWQSHNAEGLSV